MTLKGSADIGFLIMGGRNVLGRVTSLEDVEEAPVEEVTALGDGTDSWAPVGNPTYARAYQRWTLNQKGFYEPGTASYLEALEVPTAQGLIYAPAGEAIGDPFVGAETVRTKLDRLTQRGALHKLNASFLADDGCDRGYIAADLVARTTAGPTSTTTLDLGATFANQETGRMIAYLGVTALDLDGGTGVTIKVRDSSDDNTYADAITFTDVIGSTPGATWAQRSVLAAAAAPSDIERYIQIEHTFNGGAGAARSITFTVGVCRYLL